MKNLITTLLLFIGLSLNAQLTSVTEGGNTGQRLSTSNAANHGDIGSNAVDLSYSSSSSTTRGATGFSSTAMGRSTTASGAYSTAMGSSTQATGVVSTAMGVSTTASGDYSTAMGNNTTVTGDYSTAMGYKTRATGDYSTAMGYRTIASVYASTVIGQYNSSGVDSTATSSFSDTAPAFVIGNGENDSNLSDAFKVMFNGDAYVSNSLYLGGTEITSTADELNLLSGLDSLETGGLVRLFENQNFGVRLSSSDAANHGDIGNNAVDLSYSSSSSTTRGATGSYSTAMGNSTTASGYYSTAMGRNTTASGTYSTAMGVSTTASGYSSTAMGYYSTASDYASIVIGQYNSSGSTATSATSFSTTAPAFVIGNGTFGNPSDAFKVMFNGDATVSNDLTVNGNVTVSSDARLKANIVSLGATLSKLLNIDGKTYTVKKNGAQKIGVLAQDIQEVFPELVSEDNEGILSVNYQGLIPVLINALKEQEQKFRLQEERYQAQEQKFQAQEQKFQAQEQKFQAQEGRLQALERILSKE